MSEPDFTLVVGDDQPVIEEVLQNGDGTIADLTGTTVVFGFEAENGTGTRMGGAAAIIGAPTEGRVRYSWAPTDSTAGGTYLYRWTVSFPGPHQETFPNGKNPKTLLITAW